ncbi:sulfonate transport system ATP-binding protein [Nocardia amikacinitolerans]|uniref:Sulfonate transport system ATP-binding protein n=1 Tax=Nocardia amikacinitolerans TaxID=756689 RepID=A0A285L337_9NOCA|nr:ATP-binding cassette domain-containing protein [Nocardia amikacinitolerans]MCP2277976.1 sulfonate transport system ATP-binding protein [Nocardia amikacinitolerans]MCP2297686.1 sulfonate transport system ATP-binding protein [Nocardia amikacinitolerans]SNY79305.1 sulfonate transport system ATP-binding protein [Nocardia amikacinitolerans]
MSDLSGGGDPIAVSISGLRKSFGDKTVLEGVDLTIRRGEFVVLLGPSGTGKTTLLRLLTGLEIPDGGKVLVPRRRTTVYQEPRLIPSKRVLANVIVGQRRTRQNREAGLRALAEVHLDGKAGQWPATLSGGEAQRAALARALVREPELLLLDEPFAALDALTRLQMQDLVGDLVAKHRPAVLMVTHDVDEAVRLADRVLILNNGRFAVDTDIDLPRPRERSDPETLRYQTEFLTELGVGGADRRPIRSAS